jgi:hypothetical protein
MMVVMEANMKNWAKAIVVVAVILLCGGSAWSQDVLQVRDLFNGKDLSGWVNVNCAPDTWSVKDSEIVCTGKPTGVMRTDRQYENFILSFEWMHLTAGGNSGAYVWADGTVPEGKPFPKGVEVQVLELEYATQHNVTDAYVHGELFPVGAMTTVPDNPRGPRSKSAEKRCKGKGEWNSYTLVCVDGVIKMAINGKFVNGISKASQKKGYICLESEGAPIHFRNIRIIELPPGITTPEQSAPVVAEKPQPATVASAK